MAVTSTLGFLRAGLKASLPILPKPLIPSLTDMEKRLLGLGKGLDLIFILYYSMSWPSVYKAIF